MPIDRPADRPSDQPADQLVFGAPGAPRSGRKGWILGAGAAVLAIGGGAAAWAAVSFFGAGAQPAEALPGSTLGYVSVDLDPSGGQKIQALKLARKFPAFKDKVGLDTDDDLRKWLFEEIAGQTDCRLDFDDDVAPWLGSRAAVAAVGADDPSPVVVVQANDAGKVEAGVEKLLACDGDSAGRAPFGWALDGDWIVFAETTDKARAVVDEAAKGSLADDADFRRWTDKAGDSGILTAYAAPDAGQALAGDLGGVGGGGAALDPFGMLNACPGLGERGSGQQAQLADFAGAAATLRFAGDGLELEMVGDAGGAARRPSGTPVIATLPADTAVAAGVALPDGWADGITERLRQLCGGDADPTTLLAPFSDALGLSVPDDLPKLFGDSAALALGPRLDVERLANSGDPSHLPLALKTRGDEETIARVVGKLRQGLGAPAGTLDPVAGDHAVALGLDDAYVREVAADGGLGSSAGYRSVVPEGDEATAALYVDVDALDDALSAVLAGDDEVSANLAPLSRLGLSSWSEGGDTHGLLKITVD